MPRNPNRGGVSYNDKNISIFLMTCLYSRWRRLPHLKEKRDRLAWLRQSGSAGYLYAFGGIPRPQNCVECIQLTAQKSKKKTPEDYCDIDEDIFILALSVMRGKLSHRCYIHGETSVR